MKANEHFFPVVLFIMRYKVLLTFEAVDEILKCDHSNESYWAVLSCGAVYYAVHGGSNFCACKVWPFNWLKATQRYFLAVLVIMLYKLMVVPPLESLDEVLKCDYSSEINFIELIK